MDRPIIVCGLGRVGKRILDHLLAAKLPAVVVNAKLEPGDLPQGVRGLVGDCRNADVLRDAGVVDARGVIICTSDDLVNLATALTARRLNANVRIVVRTFNQNLIPRLGNAVENVFAMSVSALGAPILAMTAIAGEVIGSVQCPDGPRQIVSLPVDAGSPLAGSRVGQIADRYDLLPIAFVPPNGDTRYLLDVDPDTPLTPGDRLVACGPPRELARLMGTDDDGPMPALRLASVRRTFRGLGRALADVDRSVKVATGVLVVVLIGSTLVYHFGVGDAWPTALYHSVAVISTAADLHAEKYPASIQLFISGLRIAGAALTAAFTAIVTQYLLRARLGAAFEQRRIPDGGHIIVCGLGNVGYRVVEELIKSGEQVVAIELSREGRFFESARRLGTVILTGDATVVEVLRQANAVTAKAIIAATGNELANVEVALLARELSPELRVVVRLSDPQFANTLREGAKVRLALSVPELAAPAFVAALFGDRVHSVIRVGGRLLLIVDLAVSADDPCLEGQTVRAVAIDYGLVPVAVGTADGKATDRQGDHNLMVGDHLTAVTGPTELERLFRREPAPRNMAVEVVRFPLTARVELLRILRGEYGVNSDVEAMLSRLPCIVRRRLTKGQASDWITRLARERIEGRVIEFPMPGSIG